MKGFRDLLREARIEAGLSQEQMADLIPMNAQNYTGIETGRRPIPKDDKLEAISKVLLSKGIMVTYEVIKAWKLIDENDPSVLKEAITLLSFDEKVDLLERLLPREELLKLAQKELEKRKGNKK